MTRAKITVEQINKGVSHILSRTFLDDLGNPKERGNVVKVSGTKKGVIVTLDDGQEIVYSAKLVG